MPPHTKFLTETPRKVKTSSVPRNVKNFDLPALKESFHSELGPSIFDKDTLPQSLYQGDIIADCWFPDEVLPVVPNTELLSALTGPDRQPLYDSSTKEWALQHLPPILHKVASRRRLGPGQEEMELSAFMGIVMDALIRCHDEHLSAAASVPQESLSSPTDPCSLASPPCSNANASTPTTSSPSMFISDVPSPLPSPPGSPSTRGASAPASIPDMPIPGTPEPSPIQPSSHLHPGISAPTPRSKQEFPPRLWTSVAATQPMQGDTQLKPDCILVRQPADGITENLSWADVLMTAELTSRPETTNMTLQIESKTLAIFNAQPNRAFSYSLSFCNKKYRLCMYDRAGGVYSRFYGLHESPLPLLHILCAAAFAPTSSLGLEDTFDCRLHPVITIDGEQYFIIGKCFSSSVIRGRATTVWFVSKSVPPDKDQKNIFVIKDSWVNIERKLSEEEILKGLENVDCVLKVEKAWTVKRNGHDDSTSLRRPRAFMSLFKRQYDHRVRRRLVLTPAGCPITHAANPLEVITCLLDLVIGETHLSR